MGNKVDKRARALEGVHSTDLCIGDPNARQTLEDNQSEDTYEDAESRDHSAQAIRAGIFQLQPLELRGSEKNVDGGHEA